MHDQCIWCMYNTYLIKFIDKLTGVHSVYSGTDKCHSELIHKLYLLIKK